VESLKSKVAAAEQLSSDCQAKEVDARKEMATLMASMSKTQEAHAKVGLSSGWLFSEGLIFMTGLIHYYWLWSQYCLYN
jgi:hypothetical protein